MNIALKPDLAAQPASVSVARDERGLSAFHDPACAATLWHRAPPAEHLAWLAAVDPAALPTGRVVLRPNAVAQTVAHLCDMSGLDRGAPRDWLIADIAKLADCFAQLMEAPYLRLRLAAVTTNACRKFHLDAIKARLVCTYRGAGTQYGLSAGGDDPEHILNTPTGAPILLRGSLWPAVPDAGLLHRSPPIEGSGATRLVLVLDPVSELSAET